MRSPADFMALVEENARAKQKTILFAEGSMFSTDPYAPTDKVWPELQLKSFRKAAHELLQRSTVVGSYTFSPPDDLDDWTFYADPRR